MKMKLSYPVCAVQTEQDIMAWCEDPEEGIRYLSENGYEGIELLVRNPDKVEKEKIQNILNTYHMNISAIGTTPMQKEDHLFLLSEEKAIRDEAKRRLEGLIGLGEYFNAPVLIGKYRGTVKDIEGCRQENLEAVIEEADKMAGSKGIQLFIEPQNQDNINNLNTIEETVAWIHKNQFSNVKLLMDIFHMDKTEDSIIETLKLYQNYIGMIHMADSERKVPGFGQIDMKKILETLEIAGYQEYLSMEIKQNPDTRFAATLSSMSLQYISGGKE